MSDSDPKSDFNPMSDLRWHVSDVQYSKMCGKNGGGGRRFGRGEMFDLKSDVLKKGGKMDIRERHSVALLVRLLQRAAAANSACRPVGVSPPKEEMIYGWLAVWRITQTNKQTNKRIIVR